MAVTESLSDGEITELSVGGLEPHPRNQEIYVNADISDLVQEIQDHGFKEEHRLLVTPDKQILSGHRRWRAASKVGLQSIPAEIVKVEDEQDALFRLLLANRYRHKTPAEQINEAEAWREYYKNSDNNQISGSSKQLDKKVAEKVEISHDTISKGKKVKEIATGKRKAPKEVVEVAKKEWERMKDYDKKGEIQSVNGAYKQIQITEAEIETREQRKVTIQKKGTKPIVTQTDALELLDSVEQADLLLTDPPYSTDLEDVDGFTESWLPAALDTVSPGGCAFVFIGAYPKELLAYLSTVSDYGVLDRTQVLVWTYRNTLGQTPKNRYNLNWQAILFIQSDPPAELDSPETSEQWAVQDIKAPDARLEKRHHSWEKPEGIVERFVRHTTDEGDTVLDPFAGTGTVPLVAAELGREVVACDHDVEMLEIAKQRGCVIDN